MGFFGFGKKKEKEKEQQAEQTVRAEEKPVEPAEQPEQEEKKQGLFSRLWQGLSKTRGNVAGRVDELIEATEKIDDDFYEDLVDILIMSDMGVRTSDKVIQELNARVEKEKITDAKKAREILKEILKEIMSMPRKPLKWPMVMLVVGVNGVGKTTTIGWPCALRMPATASCWQRRIPSARRQGISCKSGRNAHRCRSSVMPRAQTRRRWFLTAFRRRRRRKPIC